MPLIAMNRLLQHALENTYAVGYFESWNLESLLAVVDAAEKTKSPVIIGFNGMFLGNDERPVAENVYHYGSLCKAIAEQATVPVSLLLNEANKVQLLVQALQAGFNGIMYVDEQTGVDGLAVSVGNVHLLERRKATLDFDLIQTLRKKIPVPLVLHGATGIVDEELHAAIRLGMCKINVGTAFKRIYLNALKTYFRDHDVDRLNPHEILGKGGNLDLLNAAREMIAAEVIRLIQLFGSEGKAHLL